MMIRRSVPRTALLLGLLAAGAAFGDGGVTFQDVAAGGANGLSYGRVPSERIAISEAIRADGVLHVDPEYPGSPYKPHGAPGVAVLDYDGDGDQDLYVTNGPGAANSLFKNLLAQTGQLQFADVAAAAGVAATAQDSQGVCYGDIDNDGDPDMMVLGSGESNLLFENQGNGTFLDITAASNAGGLTTTSASCTMGDVDGNGLLDIYIANAFDFIKTDVYVIGPEFFYHQPAQLLLNLGNNVFADASEASGVRNILDLSQPGAAMVTWASSLVDFDLDGDLDLIVTHDNRAIPFFLPPQSFVRVFSNDGTGHFTDVTAALGMNQDGSWRGLSFADFDCNARLDVFATNFGDYVFFPGFFPAGTWASRTFLQGADGTFTTPGPGALVTIPGGWGTSTADYDNDGDFDVIAYGNEETSLFWENSNPGVILQNQGLCSGELGWDAAALAGSTDHTLRTVNGLATGDLNGDGFADIVSVASQVLPDDAPLLPDFSNPLGSPFDAEAFFAWIYSPTEDPDVFAWDGVVPNPGSLSVEINDGANGNNWIAVSTLGTVGITQGGTVNRDGIGAVVSVRPTGGVTAMKPVLGGSSYASQDSLELLFGLGNGQDAMVEVLWPGGVRNRLYGVRASERILFPEIPCSFDADWQSQGQYVSCLARELGRLQRAGVLDHDGRMRFFQSAMEAYSERHGS
jgi:hypothetical protein